MFVTKNKRIQEILRTVEEISGNSSNILITGETGTGKTELAKLIYNSSNVYNSRLVLINMASIPENLIESELFGYKKGAFTDAKEDRNGLIEEANRGTLVLDEIADISIFTQAKFLDVIQEKHYKKVGDTKFRPIDLRFIACTNRNLEHEIKEGNFREDLYYRLAVFTFALPPLRERKEDIPLLVDHFINLYAGTYKKEVKGVAPDFYTILANYAWPGNVREMGNIIERVVSISKGPVLTIDDLPSNLIGRTFTMSPKEADTGDISILFDNLKAFPTLEKIEGLYINSVLKHTRYNKAKTAKILGIDRTTLYKKLNEKI